MGKEMTQKFTVIDGGKKDTDTARQDTRAERVLNLVIDNPSLSGFFGSIAVNYDTDQLAELDEVTRKEVEYMLLTDPKDDTFDFSALGLD